MKTSLKLLIFLMVILTLGSSSSINESDKKYESIYKIIEAEKLRSINNDSEEMFIFNINEIDSGFEIKEVSDKDLNKNLNVNYKNAFIIPEGKTFTGNININGGILIVNGKLTPNSFNLNKGSLIIVGESILENTNLNGEIKNYGKLVINKLNINSEGSLENNGELEINESFNNNSMFTNNKNTVINCEVNNNGNAEITNESKLTINEEMINNGKIINNDNFIVNLNLTNNGSGYIYNKGYFKVGGNLRNNGKIDGNELDKEFIRIEAESMKLFSCKINGQNGASGGKVIEGYSNSSYAEYKFDNNYGVYNLNIRYLKKKNAVSKLKLFINDKKADEWEDNETVNNDLFKTREIKNIYIEKGFIIKLALESINKSEVVVDYIDFVNNYGSINGSYIIKEETDVKYIEVNNQSKVDITLTNPIKEKSILWMKSRIVEAGEINFFLNNNKIPIRDSQYYFKWIKLGEFEGISDIHIKIENNKALLDIDKFYFTKTDIAPFNGEYAIDDLLADIEGSNKVMILFSGEYLKNADVTLYRKMTAESYFQYLKDKFGNLSKVDLILKVIQFIKDNKQEVIGTKKIIDGFDYTIIDNDPVSGYECEYYLRIDNCFGESLKSKKIFVLYDKVNNSVTFEDKHEDQFSEDDTIKRIEAEDMNTSGCKSYDRKGASGGKVLHTDNDSSNAWFDFNGNDGTYYINVRYVDECDGESIFSIYINNKMIDEWTNSVFEKNDKYKTREIKEIKLKKGDRIFYKGYRGKKNKKGHAIIDYIDFINSDKYLKNKGIYGFERNNDEIKYDAGFVKNTITGERLYINSQNKINAIPSLIKDSYYYQGLKNVENVTFNMKKFTDIYVYVPDKTRSYENYYYSKGYDLIRVPVKLATDSGNGYTYFYHKMFRPGTGDSLYLVNPKNVTENEDKSFSIYVDQDDLVIHFNAKETQLEGTDKVYIEYPDNESNAHNYGNNNKKKMKNIGIDLWEFRIIDGAEKYNNLTFEFYSKDGLSEKNSNWIWDKNIYIQELGKKDSSIVFFKELDINNIDINFANKYQLQYSGFENYLIDDGSVYSAKGEGIKYGPNYQLPVNTKEIPSNDNAKGYYNGNFISINYNRLNTALTGSDNIYIKYSYDDWLTFDTYLMQNAGYNDRVCQLYPPYGKSKISFNFTDNSLTDDNIGANWNWDFSKNANFNYGYERNLIKKNYISLPAYIDNPGEDYTWSVEVPNGIYNTYLLIEKTNKNNDANIEVNGKTYKLANPYKEIIEIRDQVLVYENKISIKNTGEFPVNIYAVLIQRDKELINLGAVLPYSFQYDGIFSDKELEDEIVEFESNNDILKVDFEIKDLTDSNKLELVFNAVSNNKDMLYFALDKNFDENNLISSVKLDNDLIKYSIDITDYINEIKSNENKLTIFIKGNKGTKVLTHKNEFSPFSILKYYVLDDKYEAYQGIGIISKADNNYIFTEQQTGKAYTAYSEIIDLNEFKDAVVMVSGFINTDEQLNIITVDPFIKIKSIEGDKYTNNQPLKWNVFSDFPLTNLMYRIQGAVDWKTIPFGQIVQEVNNDGDYILEIIPMIGNLKGLPFSHSFIVDRTGPKLTATALPLYISYKPFEIGATYSDNYSSQDDIKVFYNFNSGNEKEFNVNNGKAKSNELIPGEIIEGKSTLNVYCKDQLGNIGNIISKDITVDLTAPNLNEINVTYIKGESKQVKLDCIRYDNLTPNNELITYYKIDSQSGYSDTTSDTIFLNVNGYSEGAHQFIAYVKDKGDLTSDIISREFIVDTIPIDKPVNYQVFIENNHLKLTWDAKNNDPSFLNYRIRRSPNFDNDETKINYITAEKNEFVDKYSFYNPDYIYYVSVIDIYGNVSDEFECPAIKYKSVNGNAGDKAVLNLEVGILNVTIDENTPKKIGVINNKLNLDDNVKGEYGLLKDKIYKFAPEGAVFNTPAIWSLSVSDITGDMAANKENLTLYYYNSVKNVWEEVETKYNKSTDKLEAKINHFSTFAIGEKQEKNVELPKTSTMVSPINGSLDAVLNLINLDSKIGSYNLKLNFNSNQFDDMSKFIMNEKIVDRSGGNIKLELYVKKNEIKNKVEKQKQELDNELSRVSVIDDDFYDDMDRDVIQTIDLFDYKKSAQFYNTIDNVWDINIPKLIKNKPEDTVFKYIKFDDGSTFELKPDENGIYKNTGSKKFIFDDLTDDAITNKGFLVKLPDYINYRFNNNGNIEYIFRSNKPKEMIPVLDNLKSSEYKNNNIIFSFIYDNDNCIVKINSHDKNGNIYGNICFNYTIVYQAYGSSLNYVKKINRITKTIGNNNVTNRIDLNYNDIITTTDTTNSYISAYSHNLDVNNKQTKIIIPYQRLNSLSYYNFDNDDNKNDVSGLEDFKKENKVINYEMNGNQYLIADIYNKDIGIGNDYEYPVKFTIYSGVDEVKYVQNATTWWVNYYFFNTTLYYHLGKDDQNLEFIKNYKMKTLSKITIDEKYSKKTFEFKTYQRGKDNWNIFEDHIFNYCKNEVTSVKNNNQLSTSDNYIYYYKKNPREEITPFSNLLKIKKHEDLSLNNKDTSNINSRNFTLTVNEIANNYQFIENYTGRNNVLSATRTGKIKTNININNFEDNTGDNNYCNGNSTLEDILGGSNIFYEKNIFEYDGKQRVTGELIKIKKGVNEITWNKKRYVYNGDKLDHEETYLSDKNANLVNYEYFTIADVDEDFLSPKVAKVKGDIDNTKQMVSGFNYSTRDSNNILRMDATEKYYSTAVDNKVRIVYSYTDADDKPDSEIINNGLTKDYTYDNLYKIMKIESKGTAGVRESESTSKIIDGEINRNKVNYFDKINGNLIAEDFYKEGEEKDKRVNLYYYDYDGMKYKHVTLYFYNNNVESKAEVKVFYTKPVTINNQTYIISGEYFKYEDSTNYKAYYDNIKKIDSGDFAYTIDINNDLVIYNSDINTLKNANYNYSSLTDFSFLNAEQSLYYMNYKLLKETFKKDVDKKIIVTRYETYKTGSDGKVMSKTLDDKANYLEYNWVYDDLGNVTRETYPDDYLPPVDYHIEFDDYLKITTTINYKDKEGTQTRNTIMQRSNNMGNAYYKKVEAEDNSVNYEEFYNYNKAGQLIKKTGGDRSVEETEYNLYGILREKISDMTGQITMINNYHYYDPKTGKEQNTYSSILMNADSFNPESDWITQKEFDNFENLRKEKIKYDSQIIKEDQGISAGDYITKEYAYNIYDKPVFETSNKYSSKLDDVEYTYNSFGEPDTKTYYGWDQQNSIIIKYKEYYGYDLEYRRLKTKITTRNESEIITKTIIASYDHNNNILKTFIKDQGSNWKKEINHYDTAGNLICTENIVLDNSNLNASEDALNDAQEIMVLKKYARYDKYQRKTAEINFDGSASYTEYNDYGDVKANYTGINIANAVSLNGNNIIIDDSKLGSPIVYEYNDAGLKTSEKVLNEGNTIFENYYTYDMYGRLLTESINKYLNNNKKTRQTLYDGIGKIYKTTDDDITEEITSRQDDPLSDGKKITKITIKNCTPYYITVKYSNQGNVIYNTDKDNFKYINKNDIYGNVIESSKIKINPDNTETLIYAAANSYNNNGTFLLKSIVDAAGETGKQTEYIYDDRGRAANVQNYDGNSGTWTKKSEKTYSYYEDNQVSQVIHNIDGVPYTVGYTYNEAGMLKEITYPDGKKYIPDYDYGLSDANKDGRLRKLEFDNRKIIEGTEYVNDGMHGTIIKSYTSGNNIRALYEIDPLNRLNTLSFINTINGKKLDQVYTYDKSGNITGIEEKIGGSGGIVETVFNRRFYYDENNQLVKAEYDGSFTQEIKTKLTYQDFDYNPKQDNIPFDKLKDNSDNTVNMEWKSPSILISDKNGYDRMLKPEIIRIYKNASSHLKDVMIDPYYYTGDSYVNLEDSDYTIESNNEFFEIKNWDIDLTKIVKLKLCLDNSDIEDNSIKDASPDKKLEDIVKFYTKVDNIDIEYKYDSMGNRLSQTKTLSKANRSLIIEGKTDTYSYDTDKRLLLEDNELTYEYDTKGKGNLIKKTSKSKPVYWEYDWDVMGSLRKATSYKDAVVDYYEEYIYDEQGKRIKTIAKDFTVIYVYSGKDLIYEKKVEGGINKTKDYVHAFNKLQTVIEEENGTNKIINYYHVDILGSTRFITNEIGTVRQENLFTPFGQELVNSYKTGTNKVYYQYAGHGEANDKTGLTCMGVRWMDNATGRFISSDPAQDGQNYYVYCGNNPTTLIDPSGMRMAFMTSSIPYYTYASNSLNNSFWEKYDINKSERLIYAIIFPPFMAFDWVYHTTGFNLMGGTQAGSGPIPVGSGSPPGSGNGVSGYHGVGNVEGGGEVSSPNTGFRFSWVSPDVASMMNTIGNQSQFTLWDIMMNQNENIWDNSSDNGSMEVLDQLEDINAPTNSYCVYDTAYTAYRRVYAYYHNGVYPTEESAKAVRQAANNTWFINYDGVSTRIVNVGGRVNNFEKLADLFNNFYGTNYNYKRLAYDGAALPAGFGNTNWGYNIVVTPYVVFDRFGGHTSPYNIGMAVNQILDVWDLTRYSPNAYTIKSYGYHIYYK